MKVIYFLKKGFQFYPPCLAQVLMLDDMGVELEIYHGINSEYIDGLFDKRNIKHHQLSSDCLQQSKVQAVKKMLSYRQEAIRIIKSIPNSEILWFGNCESIIMLGKYLDGRKFVASILELYDDSKWIDGLLKKILPKAARVICCEKHRAAIMKSRYNLNRTPVVMPNKAYEMENEQLNESDMAQLNPDVLNAVQQYKDNRIVLYQGIISRDRPLTSIAQALAMIDDENVYFWVMGMVIGDASLIDEVKVIYPRTVYLGFIPNPQHLLVTRYAHIGIANYDYSKLNNVFCAPNKIYEYSQFGMPMLTSDNIGLVETVGAAGAAECVDFLNINSLRDGLKRILDYYQQYSDNAKAFYNMTDNEKTMRTICQELSQL